MASLIRPRGGPLVYPQPFPAELLSGLYAELNEDRFPLFLDYDGDLFLEHSRIEPCVWSEPPESFTNYQLICIAPPPTFSLCLLRHFKII